MTNNNFVKLGESIINISSIDGIFPNSDRYDGGWIIQLNGKDVHVDNIQPVLDAINMKTSFDPDKRITHTRPTNPTNPTATESSSFEQKAMQVKLLVIEFNRETLYPLNIDIDNKNKSISIKDGSKEMIIKDGVVIKDDLGDYSRLINIKTDIIKMFI